MLYKEMNEQQLRAAYWEERNRLSRTGELARSVSSPKARKMLARQTAGTLRRFDIICAIAKKRGIDLLCGK